MDWDRTRKWRVEKREVGRRHLRLRFGPDGPSLRDIVAVRRIFPELAHTSPAELRAGLSAAGELDLGERSPVRTSALTLAAEQAGLALVHNNVSYIQFSIIDETGPVSYFCLIEDEAELERTALEMIAAGARLVQVAED